MRTIVHVGQHKTGTKSIQAVLRGCRERFLRAGLYVPESIAGYAYPSHFILNVYALNENRHSNSKEKLLETRPPDFLAGLGETIKEDIRRHYRLAGEAGCDTVIWTNEGLYTLNSLEEYTRLRKLFEPYSSEIVCVCCFRDVASYRRSYTRQLIANGFSRSDDRDSWRYVEEDSWLFDYARKKRLLGQVFDRVIAFPYEARDNVGAFFSRIGYRVRGTRAVRLNVTR